MQESTLSKDTQAVLLLCGRFSPREQTEPLDLREYNRVTDLLQRKGQRPMSLFDPDVLDVDWSEAGLDAVRLRSLLQRGMALGLAVERWTNGGLWVLSRNDDDYPDRLRQHLGRSAPPLLWGVGDRQLLARGGLAIVGSRDVDDSDVAWAEELAAMCAGDGITVISGGARGTDQIAMAGALAAGGNAIGVLAEGLGKPSVVARYREAILGDRLVLLSPYYPDAPFTVGNAMGRNKVIYGLADAAAIVRSDVRSGGTWAGAEEELRRENAVPLFVRAEEEMAEGNRALLKIGAREFPPRPWTGIRELLATEEPTPAKAEKVSVACNDPAEEPAIPAVDASAPTYEAVLPRIVAALDVPGTAKEIAERTGMKAPQLKRWLKRAVEEKTIVKLARPARYALPQRRLFDVEGG
jgi:predicted Rossmann fold nucleotide-binding protein DprA/Smf involved in DNA uptake